MQVTVVLEVKKTDGTSQDQQAVLEAIDDEISNQLDAYWVHDERHAHSGEYHVEVIGIGTTAAEVRESRRLRKQGK